VDVGLEPGAVDPVADEDVGRLRGVEGVPEEVLVAVGAGQLERQARDLPIVPPDAAAPAVDDLEPVRGGAARDVLEHAVDVDVGEVRAGERVELVHKRHELPVEDADGGVDGLDAGDAVAAQLRQLVGAAPDLAHPHQRHLARAVAVEHLQQPRVLLRQHARVLRRRVPAPRGVEGRHEVVVQVVVAAHAHGEDALAQVRRGRVLVAQDSYQHLHRRLVVLDLPTEADAPTLPVISRVHSCLFTHHKRMCIVLVVRKSEYENVPAAALSLPGSRRRRRRS
jgi:hypothetical protein